MIKKKTIQRVLAAILVMAMCFSLAACSGEKNAAAEKENAGPTVPIVGTEKRTYTVYLKTGGGKALEDVGVYFYTDSNMTELVWFAKTDASGAVSFTDLESTGYVAVLDKVPDGYKVDPYYHLTGETTEIILETDMTDGDLAEIRYKLGDVMKNFTVTDVDGNVHTLSELLQQKQAVVLNFWYVQCAPCKAEFPYLQKAYEKYEEKIALVAMNPLNSDEEEIRAFAENLGLTFPVAHCDSNWEKAMQITAYPTTVIIDRFGTIALIHKGGIDNSKVFEDAFEFFTKDSYEQTTVEDIMDLEIKAAGSDSSTPIEIGSKTSIDVTLAAGQTVYYHIYRVDGMTLTVDNKNISAVYNKTNYPSGSGLSFTVRCPDTYTPAAVSFTNNGEETENFTIRLAAKPGTVDNPHKLKLGDFSVSVSQGNEQGVYHTYTPKKSGLLTVQCTSIKPKDVEYGITLTTQKGNATLQRSLEEDGDLETGTVSIPVKKGVSVQIVISTLPDKTKSYPAATLKCTLSIGEDNSKEDVKIEKIKYAVTVTDQDMIPLPGVFLEFTKVLGPTDPPPEAKDAIPKQQTGEAGAVGLELEKAAYDVMLTLPPGYVGDTTQFQLNQDRPYASIRLRQVVTEKKTYTVTVTDTAGKPLAGATVIIGTGFATTDASGKVSFELPVYNYSAYITAPKGYKSLADGYPFAEGATKLTIMLDKAAEGEDTGGETYTVKVVDYKGKPQSGVMVQIKKKNTPVASMATDANGVITTSLASADYTVFLAFSGSTMYYEEKTAVLPKGTTELTIKVAPAVDESTYETWGANGFYYVGVGGTYVTLQSGVVNYFIFEPEEAGIYRFTTSDPDAVISYQNVRTYLTDLTKDTDYDSKTNSFTRNVKPNNIGGNIAIGIKGAKDCILEITRIGDPVLDESDIEPVDYKPNLNPKDFKFDKTPKKFEYVDLTSDLSMADLHKDSSGYYHLNSVDGPMLYMCLGWDTLEAPYVSMYKMLGVSGVGGTAFGKTFRENGTIRKESYVDCMIAYVNSVDKSTGMYPLNDDLIYMIKNGGEGKGWWDPDNGNFLFKDDNGNPNPAGLNTDIAWMFAVCYIP